MNINNFLKNKKLTDVISENLTMREVEILTLYSLGFTKKEISENLYIALSTVDNHIQNISKKINLPKNVNKQLFMFNFFKKFEEDLYKICK